MRCGSNFWIGVGIGTVFGAIVCRLACTQAAKDLKAEMCRRAHQMTGMAGEALENAKERAIDTGVRMADIIADKAADAKEKAHAIARDLKE